MSLIDADKVGFERDNPNPNGHDVVAAGAVKAAGTTSINYTSDAISSPLKTYGFLQVVDSGVSTLNYTASTGGITTTVTPNYNTNLGLPLIVAKKVYSSTGAKGSSGVEYMVPYHEFSAAGALQLQIFTRVNWSTSPGNAITIDIIANVPTGSTYYAANQTWYVQWVVLQQNIVS